jgi:hypothetical protein
MLTMFCILHWCLDYSDIRLPGLLIVVGYWRHKTAVVYQTVTLQYYVAYSCTTHTVVVRIFFH